MLEQNSEDLAAWRNEMKVYEKQKRTKKPFGKEVSVANHVTYQMMKQKQALFNPVLQVYTNPDDDSRKIEQDNAHRAKSLMNHLRQTGKYDRAYDIVNLHSAQQFNQPESNPKKLGPLRNAYNVINNTKLPDYYFRDREIKLPIEREKNLLQNNPKEYNIVTGIYYKDHEERVRKEENEEASKVMKKYWKTHDYDPVFGKFYNEQREHEYQELRKVEEKEHGKDYESKLPPSYHLPESLQTIDEKRMNAKKRYQMKYYIEDEYGRRNIEDDAKFDQIIKNRVHNGRIEEHKAKEFDIITMKKNDPSRVEELFHKKTNTNGWEHINPDSGKIKSAGFN